PKRVNVLNAVVPSSKIKGREAFAFLPNSPVILQNAKKRTGSDPVQTCPLTFLLLPNDFRLALFKGKFQFDGLFKEGRLRVWTVTPPLAVHLFFEDDPLDL